MNSRETFSIKKGDLLPPIRATLYYEDGEVIELGGCEVHLVLSKTPGGTRKVYGEALVGTGEFAGQVQYAWEEGDTDETGLWLAEWQVTQAGRPMSVPNDHYFTVVISDGL